MLSKYGTNAMDHTTTSANGTHLAPVLYFIHVLAVGTGGTYTPAYHALRQEKALISNPHQDAQRVIANSVAVEIDFIKSTLNLTMAELARWLGVSRQTPYNWIAGLPIKSENAAKLDSLKSAADVILSANLPAHPLLLRRKLP